MYEKISPIYSINNWLSHSQGTKRGILSAVAQLYDPLGLTSPVTMVGKLFIKSLWQLKIAINLQTQWFTFQDQLTYK